MSTIVFEKIGEQNVHLLPPLYQVSFGKEISLNQVKNKFNTSFSGLSFVGFLALNQQNDAVAYYGVFPCLAKYQNKAYLVAQSGDTMTHPDHQGKGLFTQLAKKTYEYCKEVGIHLVFGFPNENSYPGFIKKLDWHHFDDMTAYHIKTSKLPIFRLKEQFALIARHFNNTKNRFTEHFKIEDAFMSSTTDYNHVSLEHSIDFVKYKQVHSPSFLIKIAEVKMWVKLSDKMFLLVGDVEKCSETQFVAAISQLKKYAAKMGFPHLRFHVSKNTWLENLLQKHAVKMANEYPVAGINLSNELPLEKCKFTMADNDTF